MTRTYDQRVRAYEADGMTRSDAQGIVDLEDLRKAKKGDTMSTHTKGPWGVIANDDSGYWQIHDEAGYICEVESESQAAFIVRACNAHEELLEALKRLQSVVRDEYHLLDVKKRASLCIADAQAGTAIAKAERRN